LVKVLVAGQHAPVVGSIRTAASTLSGASKQRGSATPATLARDSSALPSQLERSPAALCAQLVAMEQGRAREAAMEAWSK